MICENCNGTGLETQWLVCPVCSGIGHDGTLVKETVVSKVKKAVKKATKK